MKKTIFTLFVILNFIHGFHAQTWAWACDGDGVSNPKIATLNNNIYLAGTFTTTCKVKTQTLNSSAGGSGFLMKLDASGAIIWTKTFDASAVNICGVKASNGVIYVAGSFAGNLTGSSVSLNSAGDHDAFFAGFSENGVLQVAKRDGNSKYERIADFDVDSTIVVMGQFSKGSVLSGQTLTSSCNGNDNVYIAKYNLSGQNLWVKEIAGDSTQSGVAVSIRFDKAEKIIAEGDFGVGVMSYAGVSTGLCQACKPLLRFDASGNFAGLITYPQGGGGFDDSYDIAVDTGNDIYNIEMNTCGSCGGTDLRLVKYKSQGQVIWDKTLTGNTYASTSSPGTSYPFQLSQSGADIYVSGRLLDNVHFIGGDTTSGSYLFIARFDTLAGFKSLRTAAIPGMNLAQPQINEMANDGSGNVYITGLVGDPVTFGTTIVNPAGTPDKFYMAKLGSQALAVNEPVKENQFVVSPNPSQGKLFVSAKGNDKALNICVYNMLGLCILSQPMQAASVLDLSNQPKGVYFVSMEGKNTKEIKRIVVE